MDMKLKTLGDEDIGILYDWLCKRHVRQFFGDPKEWIREIKCNRISSDWIHYFLVDVNNASIGFVQYYETKKAPQGIWSDEPEGTVGIDYLIGEESYLYRGYGNDIVREIIVIIRQTNNYRFVIADPDIKNPASVSVLINNGFIIQKSGLFKLML
jgi:RimJ/RimL family protein N-acetyltransferase